MTPEQITAAGGTVYASIPADELAGLGPAYVVHGDSRKLPLPDNSVDLVVTSPPYFALRNYEDDGQVYDGQIGAEATLDGYVTSLLEVTAECMRVLKPMGSLFVNLGDKYSDRAGPAFEGSSDGYTSRYGKSNRINTSAVAPRKSLLGVPWRYALRCIDDLGLILREELIWQKPNGLPESVTDRCRRSHETWFHFTLRPRYYAAMDEIRGAVGRAGLPGGGGSYRAMKDPGEKDTNLATATANPLGKLPESVWSIATEPLDVPAHLDVDHYAAFPTEWPRRLIQGWSPAAESEPAVVLDVFGGTGTTAMVARALGRVGITVDMSRAYCRIAEWRIADSGGHYKARGVPKPKDTPHTDQLGFELGGEAS